MLPVMSSPHSEKCHSPAWQPGQQPVGDTQDLTTTQYRQSPVMNYAMATAVWWIIFLIIVLIRMMCESVQLCLE